MISSSDLFNSVLRLLPFSHCSASPEQKLESSCNSPSLSCPSSEPSNPDTCCLNHPSGHFLLTQFWDASPPLGSPENWTIHGLWPDYCTGGFEQFCDSAREHSNIDEIISSSGDLQSFMRSHWLSLNGDNNHLWSHEWNKHGTCISTLKPTCYPSDDNGLEAVTSYFTHAANLYSSLNTYATLAAAGILPSHDVRYSLADLQDAIATSHGHPVTFRCHGTELQEIWYHYSVRGPLRHASPFKESLAAQSTTTKMFVPAEPDISKSNCPRTSIQYIPKAHRGPGPAPTHSAPSHTSSSGSNPTSTATPFSGRGHLIVRPVSSSKTKRSDAQQAVLTSTNIEGCLIRGGLWYTSGSCATYLAKSDPPHFPQSEEEKDKLFTLSSLYAPCAVIPSTFPAHGGQFMCENDLGIQAIFEAVNATGGEDGKKREILAYTGKSKFYADKVPGRFEKIELYIDDKGGERDIEVEIEWQSI